MKLECFHHPSWSNRTWCSCYIHTAIVGGVLAVLVVLLVWAAMFANFRRRILKVQSVQQYNAVPNWQFTSCCGCCQARQGQYTLIWSKTRLHLATNYIGLQMAMTGLAFLAFVLSFSAVVFVLMWPEARSVTVGGLHPRLVSAGCSFIRCVAVGWGFHQEEAVVKHHRELGGPCWVLHGHYHRPVCTTLHTDAAVATPCGVESHYKPTFLLRTHSCCFATCWCSRTTLSIAEASCLPTWHSLPSICSRAPSLLCSASPTACSSLASRLCELTSTSCRPRHSTGTLLQLPTTVLSCSTSCSSTRSSGPSRTSSSSA